MNNFEQNDNKADQFVQWYVDTLENYPNNFAHYLSDDALLQWFGRSVRGPDRILYFIKTNMQGTKHNIVGVQNRPDNDKPIVIEYNNNNSTQTQNGTPESNVSTVRIDLDEIDEFAGGDGPNIDKLPLKPKTSRLPNRDLTFYETTGAIEFFRPCYKRTVAEMKWERPCTLKVGYVGGLERPIDFNIQLIIYGDNMPCKRSLLPEFDKCLSEFEDYV